MTGGEELRLALERSDNMHFNIFIRANPFPTVCLAGVDYYFNYYG
jgi:hypothetical protein